MSTKNKSPWLDNKGNILSDDQLKVVSKKWDTNTWNRYLKTLETHDREDTTYVSEDYFNSISSDDVTAIVFNLSSTDEYPFLKATLMSCLLNLPESQKEVVKLYYWEGMAIKDIAKKRGVSRQAIHKTLKRAISNLHAAMVNGDFKKRIHFIHKLMAS